MSVLTKPRLLAPMLAVVASCVLAGPIVATASASNNSIVEVVNHYSPLVSKDEHKIRSVERAYKHHRSHRRYKAIIKALRHEVADLRHLASHLKAQSASSRLAARGRDDIATGARMIARSYGRFASQLKHSWPRGVSKKQLRANRKLANAGHRKIVAGFKELKRLGY